jgi:hypothetical protein
VGRGRGGMVETTTTTTRTTTTGELIGGGRRRDRGERWASPWLWVVIGWHGVGNLRMGERRVKVGFGQTAASGGEGYAGEAKIGTPAVSGDSRLKSILAGFSGFWGHGFSGPWGYRQATI